MIDGLASRTVIGILALIVLLLIVGASASLGEAKALKDMARLSRQSALFTILVLVEISLVVVLAFA